MESHAIARRLQAKSMASPLGMCVRSYEKCSEWCVADDSEKPPWPLFTGYQFLRQYQGQRVLSKGAGRVTVGVARELVQHHDLRHPPLGRGAPAKQLTPRCGLQCGPKAGADGVVQRGVFDEVLLGG